MKEKETSEICNEYFVSPNKNVRSKMYVFLFFLEMQLSRVQLFNFNSIQVKCKYTTIISMIEKYILLKCSPSLVHGNPI